MPREKRVIVIDRTGKNALCSKCGLVVGEAAIPYSNAWFCKSCLETQRKQTVEASAQNSVVKRKLKKKGRTAKLYVQEKFESNPGTEFSIDIIAQELMDQCLTQQSVLAGAKQTASVTISVLRKEGFPIEKVSRGVYRWRPR